ncbi:MAG: excinuclease ABC subunit UvrC, partial [Candidatus Atribacteria bacterium]
MSSIDKEKLKDLLHRLPDAPGVYMMKNARGKIIYVGKAKILKNRIRSYFQSKENLDRKTGILVDSIESIEYMATENEIEALVLECTLIKEYKPKYNVRLKDDKKYPFLKLTRNEKFPRLVLTRRIQNDGSEYFGPYTDVTAVRKTLKLLQSIFPLRDCSGSRFRKNRNRECLNYQIGRCPGPCTGNIDREEYLEIVDRIGLFLKGKNITLKRILEQKMIGLSKEKRYEEASILRDQIIAIDKTSKKQNAVEVSRADEDYIAIATEGEESCGVVLRVREGKILGLESFIISDSGNISSSNIIAAFSGLYYHSATDIPVRIYMQSAPVDKTVLEQWLTLKAGRRISIRIPRRGYRNNLIRLAAKNAAMKLVASSTRKTSVIELLIEVKRTLGLSATPFRIETFDISNIQGSDAVGSMVTFENGNPAKSGYRHFRIRSVEGADDYSMMKEVLSRRLETLNTGQSRKPDLIIVDGGKGQLTSALAAMRETGITGIDLIGLAKKNEEIFIVGSSKKIVLPRRSAVLKLIQRTRDEAHRFAIEYHRKLRRKRIMHSVLDDINGIGEKRKLRLLLEFGSVDSIRKASIEEMETVSGIGKRFAEKIYEYFQKEG